MKQRYLVVVSIFLLSAMLVAQTFRGTILGTVTDPSGAVVGGATVKVRNVGTGIERTTTTSPDGSYTVSELPIGTYSVTATQSGFQTAITTAVEVSVAAERRVDVQFKAGKVSEQVEVSGDLLPQVETNSAELGGTLTTEAIENLPVNGRDYTKLIYLNPGVAGSPDQISDSPGSFGTFSMNGSRGRANNFLLDGTDMNDGFRNDPAINEAGVFGDPATILPLDAVAELRLISNYEAEYGRNSGAVVNIVTKSGTNKLHGSLLEYNRTSGVGGARNFFNTTGSQDPFHNNQFGGSLGGPIIKDRTFFYVDYEGQRESGAQSGTSCVPEPNRIAFDGGASNAVIAALLARNPWPAPNLGTRPTSSDPNWSAFDTGCPNGPNLSLSTLFSNRVDSMIAKVDHNFNPNNLLTGRYYFGDSDQSFPFAQLAGGLLPGFNTITPTRVQLVSISYVKVMGSSLNEMRLGWNRFAEGFFPQDNNFNPLSIGLNTGVTSPFDFGLPKISVGGFSPIGATNSVPRSRVDANWHFIDNYGWKVGRHDIKVGYEFRRTTIRLIQDNTFRGKLAFSGLTSLLQGIPDGGGRIAQGDTLRHSNENSHAFYIQDNFRVTSRLQLNYGIRWDYFGVVSSTGNTPFYQFDPTALGGAGDVNPVSQLYDKDLNNFAPRFGFAYDVGGKGHTVVRGGWGLFYDAFAQDIFLGHAPYNCAFCPGPAFTYKGAGAITSGTADTASPLNPNVNVFSGSTGLGDFFGTDKHIRTPYTQNFNLNVQQQFGKAVLEAGYVGAEGRKLFRFVDINQPSQAQITAADLANGVTDYGVPRNYPNFFYLNMEQSAANSTYHALQTSLRVNNFRGLTSGVNFVWSHSIDDASDSEDFIPNAAQPQDSTRPNLNRGNSNFDIRRRFSWNFAYQLPKFDGGISLLRNGWGFDGVLNLQDGQPFQLNYNFEGDYSGAGQGFDRPDVVGPVQYGKAPFNFLNLTSFAVPCTFDGLGTADINCIPGTRHFGNLGRDALRGPAFKELNFSVFKNTNLSEHVVLQFRAEFFNIFNHPNFANPNLPSFITDPAINGIAPTAQGVGQGIGYYGLAATGDVGIGNPFLGGGGPRGTQFALKITF